MARRPGKPEPRQLTAGPQGIRQIRTGDVVAGCSRSKRRPARLQHVAQSEVHHVLWRARANVRRATFPTSVAKPDKPCQLAENPRRDTQGRTHPVHIRVHGSSTPPNSYPRIPHDAAYRTVSSIKSMPGEQLANASSNPIFS